MRLRVQAGLLGLGIGLGSLLGSYLHDRYAAHLPSNPLVDEYVKVVSALYAKGESPALVEARLERLGVEDQEALLRQVAKRQSVPDEALLATGDTVGVLGALAAQVATPPPSPTQSLMVSGRGGDVTPTTRSGDSVPTVVLSSGHPVSGAVSSTKGDAFLRAEPSLAARTIKVVPGGSEILILAVERGEAVDGSEDRWYRARHGDATGYVYFNLVERLP